MTTEIIGFVDTEETIGATTPADDAQYASMGREYAETARAILETCCRLLTGREEQECRTAAGEDTGITGFNASLIDNLAIQFSREIAEWKDGRALA